MTNNENYNIILAHEKKTAQYIASKIIDKPELSVWMILVPIVFIPYMQKTQEYKEKSRVFTEGYLYTKKIALDTAYRIYTKEISFKEAQEVIFENVHKNPNADARVINIYEKQVTEIKLLCQHYTSLLSSQGTNYKELVVNFYQTCGSYIRFLNELIAAEKEVVNATSTTFKDDQDTIEVPKIMKKMEEYLSNLRFEEANLLFI